jgi:hypothetical protein
VSTSAQNFALRTGTPRIYVKTGGSGAKRARAFCPDCGSPLFTYAVGQPQTYGLRTGCIEERALLIPGKQIWCDSAMAWAMNLHNLPKSARE